MSVSSPIKRHGGKAYLATKIRDLFPEHTRFAEPYFGSGAVLLAGDGKDVAEFANDLDGQLMTFWRVLQQPELFGQFRRLCDQEALYRRWLDDHVDGPYELTVIASRGSGALSWTATPVGKATGTSLVRRAQCQPPKVPDATTEEIRRSGTAYVLLNLCRPL